MPIYFIEAKRRSGHEERLVKIGSTRGDPEKRLKTLQTGHAAKLKILRLLDGGRREEKEVHASLKHLHVRGEWFSYSDKMLTRDWGFCDLSIPEPRPIAMFPEWQTSMDRAWRKRRRETTRENQKTYRP